MHAEALVDSNVFIGLLRAKIDPVAWLGKRFDDIHTCGIVRLEVLRGVKVVHHRNVLSGFFDVLCNTPTDNSIWEEATQMAWELDRKGKVLPLQDIVIAVCSLRAGVPILTADAHFLEIPHIHVITFRTES